ncbi:DUF2924 domain-containing protein [Marimonas arenosa]|uniref:DUF2924 domain-containing protein n=1 Tax=Marimonas arenosa TaxID=1795305 RepID=A0AAE4B427_9RHOB|nr:DUF2924 domain-containing protein [Marimonas arenosa]MDQ2088984.1 DUF2924 domain-containing protein [Marimonas arenosa]
MPKSPPIEDFETMDRAALKASWAAIEGTPVPKGLSQPFLRRFLAFDLQARRYGGLPKEFEARLWMAAGNKNRSKTSSLRPGGRLIREWNGKTHVVDVTEDGFLWNGQCHRSLSAIARKITGARWSGPRFFGLNRKTNA